MAGCTENKALLLLLTIKSTTWLASLAGPVLSAVAQPATVRIPASSFTAKLAPFVKLGASFTAVTVTVNVFVTALTPPLAVPPSSVTTTVIVAVPLALVTGV